MAAPLDAALAGEGDGLALCRQDVQLALGTARVGVGQGAGDVERRPALGEQVQGGRPVERIEQRLARDRADAAPGVRAQGADGEKAAGDRDAEPAFIVAPEDGPCHGPQLRPGRRGQGENAIAGALVPAIRTGPLCPPRLYLSERDGFAIDGPATPKRSVSMPKVLAQNEGASGIVTWPPCDSAWKAP